MEKILSLNRFCRKAEEKIQHMRFSRSCEIFTERNRNFQDYNGTRWHIRVNSVTLTSFVPEFIT